jgi:hypothetical protein
VESLLLIKQQPSADLAKGKAVIVDGHMKPRGSGNKGVNEQSTSRKMCSKPYPGWTKLNVDGSCEEKEQRGGTGMVLRDEEDNVTISTCRHLRTCAIPLEAKVIACIDGLALALERADRPIILESEYQVLVSILHEDGVNRSFVATVV